MCVFLGYQIATIFRCRRRGCAGDSCEREGKACPCGCFKQPSACDSLGLAPFAGHALAFLLGCFVAIADLILVCFAIGVNRERRCRCRFVGIADVFLSPRSGCDVSSGHHIAVLWEIAKNRFHDVRKTATELLTHSTGGWVWRRRMVFHPGEPSMWNPVENSYRVPFDGSFKIKHADTRPPQGSPSRKDLKARLKAEVAAVDKLQEILYAEDRQALLLVFQAMDAAGKDGTIRAVLRGLNPAGCQVFSFKQPSARELDHDFLWRTSQRMPERGKIGIFNRSYYEEVLIVRVHPKFLGTAALSDHDYLHWAINSADLIINVGHDIIEKPPFFMEPESIRDHEQHLARAGTRIIKFFLQVSPEEQEKRLRRRITKPESHWKFSSSDLAEREYWAEYMDAYEAALNATSRPWAPWYSIPADDKPFMRVQVAQILQKTLEEMAPRYPDLSDENRDALVAHQRSLQLEGDED